MKKQKAPLGTWPMAPYTWCPRRSWIFSRASGRKRSISARKSCLLSWDASTRSTTAFTIATSERSKAFARHGSTTRMPSPGNARGVQAIYVDSMSAFNSLRLKFSKSLEIDRAVFFGLLSRIWGLAAGGVTAILIATYFSPEIQGYYYTFTTILALQVFAELGLGTVAVQFASHEWSKLNLDESGRIVGDGDALSRLVSVAKVVTRWFLFAGVLVAVGVGAAGYVFFSTSPDHNIDWVSPWFLLCAV